MSVKANLCVVIPIYKIAPSLNEIASFNQCISVLGNYDIYIVCPDTINITDAYSKVHNITAVKVIRFSNHYFESISGYNKLMLSTRFYEQFSSYQYMLIYQLDAWIFKDDLQYWCRKGYDYVGAPWVDWEWSAFYARHITFTRRQLYRLGYRSFNLVGNGGFSLRKISTAIFNLKLFSKTVAKFDQNEDFFFGYVINSYNLFYKVAPFKEALQFGFDELPEKLFEKNNGRLPMGCHAWPKYFDFWKAYIHPEKVL